MSTNYEKKVIIVGKTGNGKSSLGNTLLPERKPFIASKGSNAVTTECQKEANIGEITVVDTPGLFDTTETNGTVNKITSNALTILESLDKCCEPHAFLFTLSGANRFTDEELSVIDVLTIIFGTEWTDHAIIVVTHIDNDDEESDFKKYWEDCEKLNEFVKKCNGRICQIDNKHPKKEHVDRILVNIDEASQNGTFPFSIKFSDCRKKVLQNEKKLEEYNGMPTHRIIRAIGESVKASIEEKIRQQEQQRQKRRQWYKKIETAATYIAQVVAGAACLVAPDKLALTGVCIGAFAIRCTWFYFKRD